MTSNETTQHHAHHSFKIMNATFHCEPTLSATTGGLMNVSMSKSMTRMISMSASVTPCSFVQISLAMIMVQNGSQDTMDSHGSNARLRSISSRDSWSGYRGVRSQLLDAIGGDSQWPGASSGGRSHGCPVKLPAVHFWGKE